MAPRTLLVVLCIGLLVLSGCSRASRLGATVDASGRVGFETALCEGEVVHVVEVHGGGGHDDELLWQIRSDAGVAQRDFVVGETPPGFVEEVALRRPLTDGPYLAAVRTDVNEEHARFELGKLRPGLFDVDGQMLTGRELRARADRSDACDEFRVPDLGFVVGVVGLVVALCAFWIAKIVEVASIPEDQYRRAGTDKTTWVLVVVLASLIGALIWQFARRRRVRAADRATSSPAVAGWYPGPGGVLRWWDGRRWTSHHHVRPPPR